VWPLQHHQPVLGGQARDHQAGSHLKPQGPARMRKSYLHNM